MKVAEGIRAVRFWCAAAVAIAAASQQPPGVGLTIAHPLPKARTRHADLPILRRFEVYSHNPDDAVGAAKRRVDAALLP